MVGTTELGRIDEIVDKILEVLMFGNIGVIQYIEYEHEGRFDTSEGEGAAAQLARYPALGIKEYEEDLVREAIRRFENNSHYGAIFTRTQISPVGQPTRHRVTLVVR